MKTFYENVSVLDKYRKLEKPTDKDLSKVLHMIQDDPELTRYFYDKLNPGWLELLEGAKEFEGLDVKEAGVVERYKAAYLLECAEANPEVVQRIIKGIAAKDVWVQGKLAGGIAK